MQNTVTVIIPTYNRASLVRHAIRNMIDQTMAPHEIIVVDDGSTDNTREVVQSFAGPVRYLWQRNQGPAAARNVGLAAATGRYVQFMDSDDLASLNKLEEQVKALELNRADMAYGPWIQLEITDNAAVLPAEVLQGAPVPETAPFYEWHLRGWALVLQNCLFRREFLGRIGPFREDLMMTEDTEYLNRIFVSDPRIVFTPSCLVVYRVHDENKLTHEGTSSSHKTLHWARALNYMVGNMEANGKTLGVATRLSLGQLGWSIQARLRTIPGATSEPLEKLDRAVRRFPTWVYRFYALWRRVSAGAMRRATGSTWPSSYRRRRINQDDIQMLQALGLRIAKRPDSGSAQTVS